MSQPVPTPLRGRAPGEPRPSRRAAAFAATLATVAASTALVLLVSTRAAAISPVLPFVAVPFMGVAVWLFFERRVELSLAVLVLYLGLVDGVVKLMSNVEASALGRDVLLYAIAAGMLARVVVERRPLVIPPWTGWVVAWTAVVLVQLLNPDNGSWLHSVSSLRQDLEFVPLFFIAYVVMTTIRRLRAFMLALLLIAAINGVVGFVQFGLTPEQLAGWGGGYAELFSAEGGSPRTSVGADGKARVRPPGLGSDMGFAGVLGAIAIPCGIALALTRRRPRELWLLLALLVLAAVGVLTSQSRSTLITTVVIALAFVALMTVSGQARRVVLPVVLVGVLASLALLVVGSRDDGALFRYRSITPDRLVQTTIESRRGTLGLVPEYMREFPFGAGIGSVGPAAGTIGGSTKNQPNAESQFTFLIAEVGIPGLLVYVAFYLHVLAVVVARLRRERERELQIVLAALAAPLFGFAANWIVGVNSVSTPNSPYMWFVFGVLALWLLTRQQRGHPRLPAEAA